MKGALRIFPIFIVFFILLCCSNVPVGPEPPDQSNPILYVEPTYLEFDYEVDELPFSIENKGCGTINWQINPDVKWIECMDQLGDPVCEGDTTSEIDPVTVRVNREIKELDEINYGTVLLSWSKGQEEIEVTMYFHATRKVYGKVTDAANEDPIVEAQVWIDPEDEYLSDGYGYYIIYNAPTNGFTVCAFKEGFLPYESDKQLAGTEDVLLDIQLQKEN